MTPLRLSSRRILSASASSSPSPAAPSSLRACRAASTSVSRPQQRRQTPTMPPSRPSSRSSQVAGHLRAAPGTRTLSNVAPLKKTPAPGLPEQHTGGGPNQDEPKVYVTQRQGLYEIVLNRQKALNALDRDMVRGINGALEQAAHDSRLAVIVLRPGDESRGLCSGGDVLQIVQRLDSDETRMGSLDFFKEEFEVDWKIAKLCEQVTLEQSPNARPMVAVMDGITFGGGVGLSVHAPFRIVTERTLFSMPETGIGYFPDVGVTRVLARLDGKIGTYLGVTGKRISGAEAYIAGLGTHMVPSSRLEALYDALGALPPGAHPDQISATIDDYTVNPFDYEAYPKNVDPLKSSPLLGDCRTVIDYVFGQPSVDTVVDVLRELDQDPAQMVQTQAVQELRDFFGLDLATAGAEVQGTIRDWARETLATLSHNSPRSLKVAHQAINFEARRMDIDESFRFDMRLATVFCDLHAGRDFHTGVTHVLGKQPDGKRATGRAAWDPPQLEQVADDKVRGLFFGPVEEAKEQHGLTLSPVELDGIPPLPKSVEARHARSVRLRGLGPKGWEPEFNAFHPLPSEAELESFVHGSHPASGSLQVDLESEEALGEITDAVLGVGGRARRRAQAWGARNKVEAWIKRKLALQRAQEAAKA